MKLWNAIIMIGITNHVMMMVENAIRRMDLFRFKKNHVEISSNSSSHLSFFLFEYIIVVFIVDIDETTFFF